MNLLTLLLTTLSLLPTPSYTQESPTSSSSSSDEDTSSTSSFTVTAYRSNSPINNLALTIFSGRFYLGGRTSSYCPPGVASEGECPPGNETIIVGDNGLVRTSSPIYPPIILTPLIYPVRLRPRRPTNLHPLDRRPLLHSPTLRLHAPGFLNRPIQLHARHTLRKLELHGLSGWIHCLSCERRSWRK